MRDGVEALRSDSGPWREDDGLEGFGIQVGKTIEMERIFGISYPTVKNRLNRIAENFELVEVESRPAQTEVLALLEQGEITFEEALGRLSQRTRR
ncbi:MAG: DUF2089 family protein [Candidatus Hydrogenedentes bacterium]|nr:DUF2089 family protein [Candidatus Hydrogenedentota bacterium]